MPSSFGKTIAGLCFCLVVAEIVSAKPSLNFTINGKLGPVINGHDPLGLNGASFEATTSLNPVGVNYNPSSITYTGLSFTLTVDAIPLTCTGASATVTLNDASDSGNDTFVLTNCNLPAGETFTATLAFPPNTLPSPIPLAFSSNIVSNPDTASTGTYVVGGKSTTLGISGTTTAACNLCPAMTLTPSAPLTFNAPLAGSAPPPQRVKVGTDSTAMAYAIAVTVATGNWLNVNPAGGQTGGSFSVSVNQQGLSVGTYNGAVTVYTAASNSPQTLPVTMVVYPASLNLIATPSSITFESALGVSPPAQTLSVTASDSSAVPYTAAVTTSDGNAWLVVSPTSGTTGGAALSVATDLTKVQRAGTYHGTITLTASGVSPLAVPVTLRLLGSLYSFAGGNDGAGPAAPVLIGSGSVLYGTTAVGGASNLGIAFSLTPPTSPGGAWTEEVLYAFTGGSDGANPRAGLAAHNGIFYGVTESGGASGFGTVFSLQPHASGQWLETVLYSFTSGTDGGYPQGRLVLGSGVLYGTTTYGGKYGRGTVFSLTKPASPGAPWTEAVLYNFGKPGDGINPYGGMVADSGGVLYGTTYGGGASNAGTVFSLTPPATLGARWTEAVLYSFTGGPDGGSLYAGVIVGQGGVLYGTAHNGGSQAGGVAFSLTPPVAGGPWTETVLYNFGFFSGQFPRGGLVLKSGALYGTTSAGGRATGDLGTVFKLLPPASPGGAWKYSVLHSFTGTDGATPVDGLALSAAGVFYGTTSAGGSSNLGTVFLITP
jgi:uncharacterized repeat protein (TIGR03803 family)